MTKEEKEAIKKLKEKLHKAKTTLFYENVIIPQDTAEEIFNLIDKQQKEIEMLKAITQNYNAIGGETFGNDSIVVCSMKYFDNGFFKRNYISKDKIREKLDYQYMLWNTPNRQKEYNLELAETLEELLEEEK